MANNKTISLDQNLPVPVNVTIQHVNAETSVENHVEADAQLFTASLAMLLQTFPKLTSLDEICKLTDQVMKTIKQRRELCLKPTCIKETEDSEVNITPVR
jgi:hypothetical protein